MYLKPSYTEWREVSFIPVSQELWEGTCSGGRAFIFRDFPGKETNSELIYKTKDHTVPRKPPQNEGSRRDQGGEERGRV